MKSLIFSCCFYFRPFCLLDCEYFDSLKKVLLCLTKTGSCFETFFHSIQLPLKAYSMKISLFLLHTCIDICMSERCIYLYINVYQKKRRQSRLYPITVFQSPLPHHV
eukprot:Sdes_comp19192_c0_seq2m10036